MANSSNKSLKVVPRFTALFQMFGFWGGHCSCAVADSPTQHSRGTAEKRGSPSIKTLSIEPKRRFTA